MAVSVFRRYTPPTCTLELRGERSPLSAWSDRPIVKRVQFLLSIDGPQRRPEDRVTIKGGRSQLDHLHHAIDAYVQQILELPSRQFQSTLLQPKLNLHRPTREFHSPDVLVNEPSAPNLPPRPGQSVSLPGRMEELGWSESHTNDVIPGSTTPKGVTLRPRGVLKHELHLGPLAPSPSNSSVLLSTTELFDLAHALDSYHGEVDSLPELTPVRRVAGVSPWMKGAAVAVLAIGVTSSLVSVWQSSNLDVAVDTTSTESALNQVESQAAQPQISDRTTIALETIPSAEEALPPLDQRSQATATRLDTTEAKTESDTSADASQTDSEKARRTEVGGIEAGAVVAGDSDAEEIEAGGIEAGGRDAGDVVVGGTDAGGRDAGDVVVGGTDAGGRDAGAIASRELATNPLSSPSIASGAAVSAPSNPESLPSAEPPPAVGEIPTDAILPPELTTIPPIPPINSPLNPAAPPSAFDAVPNSAATPGAINSSSVNGQQNGQQDQVQAYFEDQWQPPNALKQSLQFRLLFNSDGSLQQVIPLGESARSYRSSVNIPAPGTPFVAPFGGSEAPPMRLVLGTNGQVRVFFESLD